MRVLVEDAAEAVASADVQAGGAPGSGIDRGSARSGLWGVRSLPGL
jgi:hypothetical protein